MLGHCVSLVKYFCFESLLRTLATWSKTKNGDLSLSYQSDSGKRYVQMQHLQNQNFEQGMFTETKLYQKYVAHGSDFTQRFADDGRKKIIKIRCQWIGFFVKLSRNALYQALFGKKKTQKP